MFVEFQANGRSFTGLLPADEAKVRAGLCSGVFDGSNRF